MSKRSATKCIFMPKCKSIFRFWLVAIHTVLQGFSNCMPTPTGSATSPSGSPSFGLLSRSDTSKGKCSRLDLSHYFSQHQ
jgi:hypothetical protein